MTGMLDGFLSGPFAGEWANTGVTLLRDLSLKAVVVLAAAAGATLVWRRASAAARHMVWSLALAGMLTLPAWSALLPAWTMPELPEVTIQVRRPSAEASPPMASIPSTTAPEAASIGPAAWPSPTVDLPIVVQSAPDAAPPLPDISWQAWLLIVWGLGAVLAVLPLAAGMLRVRRLARQARPARDEVWGALARRLMQQLGMRREVRILESDTSMPMTWGTLRPAILLPADADHWAEWQRRDVLMHELAHVRRFDCLTQFVAQLACAMHWFNPFAWLAARRLRVEREHACDDCVLSAGAKASEYANHLLEVARSLRADGVTTFAAVAMARPSQLSERLMAVLDERRGRWGVTRRVAIPAWAIAAGIILPLAAMTPARHVAAATVAPDESARPVAAAPARVDSAGRAAPAVTAPRRQDLAAAPPISPSPATAPSSAVVDFRLLQQPCEDTGRETKGTNVNWSSSRDDDEGGRTWTVTYRRGRCRFDMDVRGKITFNKDLNDIETLSAGGTFELEQRDGDESRRLVVRERGGELQRTFYVNGARAEYNDEARKWLGAMLIDLDRRTGFAAEQRVPKLLKDGGVTGVLAEISRIESDYAKRIYYGVLLDQAKLSSGEVQQAVRQAGAEIKSDYELTELLMKLGKLDSFTNASHPAYVEAVRTIQSDYERRRALSTLLKQEGLSAPTVKALVEAGSEMKSDYEKAELLIAVSRQYAVSDDTRPTYFQAAQGLKSDYERRRVMDMLLKSGGVNAGQAKSVLQTAAQMGSDYERAELLVRMAKGDLIDPAWRSDFFASMKGMKSDYEKRRVLNTVLTSLKARDGLSKDWVKSLLDASAEIGSDYEQAEMLVAVAKAYPIDEDLRPSYEKAADSIGSDHDYGRAMTALRGARRTTRPQ